jgi:hypothetical protein
MKYMLLIYPGTTASDELSEDEQQSVTGEYLAIRSAPGIEAGARLEPVSTATTVRVEHGSVLATDGPFVETKEELGGYYLLEAPDLDAAIEMAVRIPAARLGGAVEVRPVVHS